MYTNGNINIRLCFDHQVKLNLVGDYFLGESQRKLSGEWSIYIEDDKIFLEDNIEVLMSAQDITLLPVNAKECNCTLDLRAENKQGFSNENSFRGNIVIVKKDDCIEVINEIDIEAFVTSILCNSFSSNSDIEYLKLQAIIIRNASILLSLNQESSEVYSNENEFENSVYCRNLNFSPFKLKDKYRGESKECNKVAHLAARETEGIALVYKDTVSVVPQCICCGGITEAIEKPLKRICDSEQFNNIDLTENDNFEQWIYGGTDSYCNSENNDILNSLISDNGLIQTKLFRWTETIEGIEVNTILRNNFNKNIGKIIGFKILNRGTSGSIKEMEILGEIGNFNLKEKKLDLFIGLFDLPSRSFNIEKKHGNNGIVFVVNGVGTGNGMGVCHIGACAMARSGKKMEEIIEHYIPLFLVEKQY